jgi:hypothetical protein
MEGESREGKRKEGIGRMSNGGEGELGRFEESKTEDPGGQR